MGCLDFVSENELTCVKIPLKIDYTAKDRIILIGFMYDMGVNAVAVKNGSKVFL